MEIKYANLDGDAVRLTDYEAWRFINEQWQPLNSGEANHQARLMNANAFTSMFPDLPALPPTAFKGQ